MKARTTSPPRDGPSIQVPVGPRFTGALRRPRRRGEAVGREDPTLTTGRRAIPEAATRISQDTLFRAQGPPREPLRQALLECEASGDAGALNFDEIRREARKRAGLAPGSA